ncbi:MAG: hypothetical protein C3F11_20675 [Methylocystaceae bacterium]|nr:MAG: hypothetical protein C3F11_20675 [Methylocystaceae bacterium]
MRWIGWLMLCLYLAQSIALTVAVGAGYGQAASSAGPMATASKDCSFAGGGEESPREQHRPHEHCCILCASSDIGGGARFVAVLVAIVGFFERPPSASRLVFDSFDSAIHSTKGWMSSWSSRAPPVFS